MNLRLLVKITAIIALFAIFTNSAAATNVTIEKVDVRYESSNISVEFYYQLDTLQQIKGFFFGANYIEDDLLSLFNDSVNLKVDKVDLNNAEMRMDVIKLNDTTYFPGVMLTEPVENVTLYFPGNSTVNLNETSRIPQAFY
ncbi:MAG: hypothetical protein R6U44_05415 [Archaeoglobaceae archaeon]